MKKGKKMNLTCYQAVTKGGMEHPWSLRSEEILSTGGEMGTWWVGIGIK